MTKVREFIPGTQKIENMPIVFNTRANYSLVRSEQSELKYRLVH